MTFISPLVMVVLPAALSPTMPRMTGRRLVMEISLHPPRYAAPALPGRRGEEARDNKETGIQSSATSRTLARAFPTGYCLPSPSPRHIEFDVAPEFHRVAEFGAVPGGLFEGHAGGDGLGGD